MFDLDDQVLDGSVLDCCAGASSFVADVVAGGGTAVAVDPAYAWSAAALATAAADGLGDGNQIIDHHGDQFVWDWYGTPQRRDQLRREAAARFLADLDRRPASYVAAALPRLPFTDGSFDLVVCSHLLFTWSDVLDADWHLAAIAEMVRVARRDVRIFPIVVQGTGEPVPFLDDLLTRLRGAGHRVEIRRVPYVFQHGADSMLTIQPGAAHPDTGLESVM